jgi:hypothetical protein
MTIAKWAISTQEQQDLHYSAARFNEKGCLPVWGGDGMLFVLTHHRTSHIMLQSSGGNFEVKILGKFWIDVYF